METLNHIFLAALGMQELLVIGVVILLFFGGSKLPQLMKGLGEGISEFKKGVSDIKSDNEDKK